MEIEVNLSDAIQKEEILTIYRANKWPSLEGLPLKIIKAAT